MIARRLTHRWLPLFAAGALASRAFAPSAWWWALPPALMALFFFWSRAATAREAFLDGWWWGMGLYGFGLFWLHISIDQYGGLGVPAAIAIALSFIAYLALFPALSGWLAVRLRQDSPARDLVWLMPTVFVLGECLRGSLFTGFPWLLIGYGALDTPLAALAPLGGVWLLDWLLAWLAGLGVAALVAGAWWPRVLLVMIGIALWIVLPGLQQREWTRPSGEALPVAIIQPNIAQREKWKPERLRPTLRLFERLSMRAAERGARLVLWPETAIPAFLGQIEPYWLRPLADRLRAHGAELLLGIPLREKDGSRYYNAVVHPLPERGMASYAKRHLVPFGEYAPLASLTRPLIDALGIPMASFSAGETGHRPLLRVAGHQAGLSICYEDIFSDEVLEALPEADFLVNVSNDAWFGDSAAPWQHLRMARMRALETGRYLLRGTNTGVSAIIDPHGAPRALSGLSTREVVRGEIVPMSGMTPYARIGAGAVPTALALLLGLLALRSRCRGRSLRRRGHRQASVRPGGS